MLVYVAKTGRGIVVAVPIEPKSNVARLARFASDSGVGGRRFRGRTKSMSSSVSAMSLSARSAAAWSDVSDISDSDASSSGGRRTPLKCVCDYATFYRWRTDNVTRYNWTSLVVRDFPLSISIFRCAYPRSPLTLMQRVTHFICSLN